VLQLRGRENNFAELASGKVREFVSFLSDIYKTDEAPIAKTGNTFAVLLYPKK
jgi:translation initiation factor IF-3